MCQKRVLVMSYWKIYNDIVNNCQERKVIVIPPTRPHTGPLTQCGAVEARLVHAQEVAGSSPAIAIS